MQLGVTCACGCHLLSDGRKLICILHQVCGENDIMLSCLCTSCVIDPGAPTCISAYRYWIDHDLCLATHSDHALCMEDCTAQGTSWNQRVQKYASSENDLLESHLVLHSKLTSQLNLLTGRPFKTEPWIMVLILLLCDNAKWIVADYLLRWLYRYMHIKSFRAKTTNRTPPPPFSPPRCAELTSRQTKLRRYRVSMVS